MIPIALLALAGPTRADQLPLFNTGVDATGSILPVDATDPHWTVVAGPGFAANQPAFITGSQLVYAPQETGSRWIWVTPSGYGDAVDSPYTFRLTFDLTGFDPNTARVSGNWGVDNDGRIQLNGKDAVGTGTFTLDDSTPYESNFEVLHAFTITGGFVAGINTLDFVATDEENPGALNVAGLVGTDTAGAVPEPASFLMLGAGAVGVACCASRRGAKARANHA